MPEISVELSASVSVTCACCHRKKEEDFDDVRSRSNIRENLKDIFRNKLLGDGWTVKVEPIRYICPDCSDEVDVGNDGN